MTHLFNPVTNTSRSGKLVRALQAGLIGAAAVVGLAGQNGLAGEIRSVGGAAGLGSRVNGIRGGACGAGVCRVSGGTKAGANLFHRFSSFDTRRTIEGVSIKTHGRNNVLLGVTAPRGSFIDVPVWLDRKASLMLLSPGGIQIRRGGSFQNVAGLSLSTATGLKVGNDLFNVGSTSAQQAAELDGVVQTSWQALVHDPAELSRIGLDQRGDISLAGGLLTIDASLFVDARRGNLRVSESMVQAPGSEVRLQADQVTLTQTTVDVSAPGDQGGRVVISGDTVVLRGSQLDASGSSRGGEILLGGGQQGQDPDVPNAARLLLDRSTEVRADGLGRGDGGRVIAFSTGQSAIGAILSARGGENGGNGGFIETSGAELRVAVTPDASAPRGQGGKWLIDPVDLSIVPGNGLNNALEQSGEGFADFFPDDGPGPGSFVGVDLINQALTAGLEVAVTNSFTDFGDEPGDIKILAPIRRSANNNINNTLRIDAYRDIDINVAGVAIANNSAGLMDVIMTTGLFLDQGGSGQVNWISGDISLGPSSTWTVNGSLNVQGAGVKRLQSGFLQVLSPSFQTPYGMLRVAPTSVLEIGNNASIRAGSLDNRGTIQLAGVEPLGASLNLYLPAGGGTIENQGTLAGQGLVSVQYQPTEAGPVEPTSFINSGALRPTGQLSIRADDFTNTGTVALTGLGNALTVISSRDQVQATNTGLITGAGLFSLTSSMSQEVPTQTTLINSGTIEATGDLQLGVDRLQLTSTSALKVDISSGDGRITLPTGQVDQIDGALNVVSSTAFTAGEEFAVLVAEGFNGTAADFTSVSFPNPGYIDLGISSFNSFAYLVKAPTITGQGPTPEPQPPSPTTPTPEPQPPSTTTPTPKPQEPKPKEPKPTQPEPELPLPPISQLYPQVFFPSNPVEGGQDPDPFSVKSFSVELLDRISSPSLSLLWETNGAGTSGGGGDFNVVIEEMTPDQAIKIFRLGEIGRTQDTKETIRDVEPPAGAPESIDTDTLQRALRRAASVIRGEVSQP